MQNKISGFSVIELVIALAVGAIVVTMAAPTMTGLVRGSRLTSTSNSMTTALNFARMEAIRRQVRMSVVPVNGAADWNGGWTVRQGGVNGTIVRTFPAPDAKVRVNSVTPTTASYDFLPTGFLSVAIGDSIQVCNATGGTGRLITVTGSGKVDLDPRFQCP